VIHRLRIVADDLTGALDAAAPFASPDRPVEVPWLCGAEPTSALVAATSESRNATREDAIGQTLQTFRLIEPGMPGALWFKKVDSVLRGHPVAETAALIRAGGFHRCIFAPAFPEMGRITRNGRQALVGPEGEYPVGPPDLVAAFAQEGLAAALADAPSRSGSTVLIADAGTPGDLLELVHNHSASEDVLWVGSRGLAAALAGPSPPRPIPPIGVIVVGTSHPATREQVRSIEAQVTRAGPDDILRFDAARPLLIDPVSDAADATETRHGLLKAFGRLMLVEDHRDGLIVVGGDTLSTVLEATGTSSLEVFGEVRPGIPLVLVRGGHLDGRRMVTKSGGFGSPDLLASLLAHCNSDHP
jgi:uncharacterized protein YgbK (DUF1537 family)